MKRAGAIFATITAMLEDMHAVAVEGQAPDLSPDERLTMLSILRASIDRLERRISQASTALTR